MGVRGTRRNGGHGPEKLTEGKIQEVLRNKYLSKPKYELENLFVFDWESDYLAKTENGYWYEVEIKVSLADFKNDRKHKKEKYNILESDDPDRRCPNYFSYCVPENLVEKVRDLIPDYAGLYYIPSYGGIVSCEKYPEKILERKLTDDELNLTEKFYYNMKTAQEKVDKCIIEQLREELRWVKDEFEAVAGYPFKEIL